MLSRPARFLLPILLLALSLSGCGFSEPSEDRDIQERVLGDTRAHLAVLEFSTSANQYYREHARSYQGYPSRGALPAGLLSGNKNLIGSGDPIQDKRVAALPTLKAKSSPSRIYIHLTPDGKGILGCSIPDQGSGAYCQYGQRTRNGYRQRSSTVSSNNQEPVRLGELARSALSGKPLKPAIQVIKDNPAAS